MNERPVLKLVHPDSMHRPPPHAGAYWLGGNTGEGLAFTLRERPSLWHRFWTRVLLGWHWRDAQ